MMLRGEPGSKLSKTETVLKKHTNTARQHLICLVRFPAIQERNQIFLHHGSRRFELSIAAAIKQASIVTQNCNSRHTFIQGRLVLLREVEVLVAFADVHVHKDKAFLYNLVRVTFMQRAVEHVTVVTPVAAEDEEYAFLADDRLLQRFIDFFLRVSVRRIEIRLADHRR